MRNHFRSGLQQFVRFHVAPETVIEPGMLLWHELGYVRPAAEFTWDTDLATTRVGFRAVFAGVAVGRSGEGETDDVLVDTSPLAIWNFAATANTFEAGMYLGPTEDSSTLNNYTLEEVSNAAHSIARAMENSSGLMGTVNAGFRSTVHVAAA